MRQLTWDPRACSRRPTTLAVATSAREVATAEDAGLRVAGLGPRILRSESVAVAAAAVILSRTGDFA